MILSSSTRSLLRRQKQRSCVHIIYIIAAAGVAIIMFIQGKLLLISQNSVGPQKEEDAPQYIINPNLKQHEPYNISQLPGLWKASQFTGMNSDISQKKKIIIVVSHCNKPLHWMQDYIVGSLFVITKIYIFSKCGEQPQGAPEGAIVQTLSNVGRCDHTYAYYITEILPQEVGVVDSSSSVAKQRETIIVFIKDNRINHQGFEEIRNFESMIRLASSSNGFGCHSSPLQHASAYHNITLLSQFEIGSYSSSGSNNDNNVPFKSSHVNLGEYWRTINLSLSQQQFVPVCYGGIFAVSVENIYKQDMTMWKKFEVSLRRGDNIEEGHYGERSWAAMLSNPLDPLQIEALRNYSTGNGGWPMNGMLTHE
jgi:hypothetical protein